MPICRSRMSERDGDGREPLGELWARLERANLQCPDDAEVQAILADVRSAARTEPGFRAWLRDLPRTRDGARAMVYEALVLDVEAHGALLLEELTEALSLAEDSPDPRAVLDAFGELTEAATTPLGAHVRERVAAGLGSSSPVIRAWAVDLVSDFLEPTDTALLLRVRTLMDKDPDLRVREVAFRSLRRLDLLPAGAAPSATLAGHPLGWWDRLRAWVLRRG